MPFPEAYTHKKIKNKLKEIGYKECKGYKEHQLIEDYLLKDVLVRKIKELNESEFNLKGIKDIDKVIDKVLNKFLSTNNSVQVLDYLKDGMIIELDRGKKGNVAVKVKFIDFDNIDNNDFCFIHEAKFKGYPDNIKPDFTLFINGIPIAIIEAKREFSEDEESYTYEEGLIQIERYEKDAYKLFNFVQVGIVFADKQVYFPTYPNPDKEKRLNRKINIWKDEKGNENIFEFLKPNTFLDILKNFIFFGIKGNNSIFKVLPRYMQYKAVNLAFSRIKDYLDGKSNKNKGLIWHWQGSGKTFEIIYLAEKFFRTFENKKPIVFIIVDRKDLERQFNDVIFSLRNTKFQSVFKKIESVNELKSVIQNIKDSENKINVDPKAVYLVMAHKFRKELIKNLESSLEKINKKEILILRDEAHRTEGGKSILAAVRNYILPNALKFGFTGTPVHRQENNTFQEYAYPQENEFYLDKYFIEQSIKDGFTLPLAWRVAISEGVSLKLTEEEIKNLVLSYFVNRQLDEEEETIEVPESQVKEKLPFSDLLKAEDFIKKASEYIAKNIKDDTENFNFKAMVVAQNRESAIKFKKYLDDFMPKFVKDYTPEWSQVIITYSHNDEDIIREYRKQIEITYGKSIEELQKKWIEDFKLPNKNPKILIVNKKLLTGFDAPILKVMYIAQLMKDVTLLQASARANRTYPLKKYGLIVDLCGVLIENYKKAIEEYNLYQDEKINKDILENLFRNISELWEDFLEKLKEIEELFKEVTNVNWSEFLKILKEGNKEIFKDIIDKIITSKEGIAELYPLLKEAVKIYEAIGAYPEKVKYYEIYQDLKILSAAITKKVKPRVKIPKELKKELSKYWEFEEIKEIADLKFSIDTIEKLRQLGKDYIIIADYLIPTLSYLEDKKDFIYRVIYKRLNELRNKYLNRKVDIQKIIETLNKSIEDIKNYEKIKKSLSIESIVLKNLEFFLNYEGIRINLTPELKATIKEFLEKKPTEEVKTKVKEGLILSVEKNEEKLGKLLDYIIEEILMMYKREIESERH